MHSFLNRRPDALALLIWLAVVTLFSFVPANLSVSAKSAAVRLPEDLAENSVRIDLDGFSGYNRGRYEGAGFRGEFTRIESRLGVFDPLYVANKARSSFSIEDDSGEVMISAECRATERTATVRFVSIDLDKLTYECQFGGHALSAPARFVLGEPKRNGFREKLLARDRRTGEAELQGMSFMFQSIHEYEGSRLNSQTPLGYSIESGGSVIAAVDMLDWNPVVYLLNDLDPLERQPVMAVALALAVLRDPANSTLEDSVR